MHQFSTAIGADNEALFRALIATSVDGIMVIDEMGTVLVYSDACARLFGYRSEEVLGRNVKMLMPEPYHGEHDDYLSRYRATGERHVIGIGRDVTGRRNDGSTFPMYLSIGEGRLGERRIFVGIVHDITGQKERDHKIQELQDELLHTARVTAMGQMSSAIAHELNQPLGAILAYTGAIERLIDASDPAQEDLRAAARHVSQDAARAGQIIRRLRSFVEKRASNRMLEKMTPVIAEATSLASVDLGTKGIIISTEIAPAIPDLFIDRIQIQQVLVNLIRNAVDALDGHNSPTILVKARPDGPDHIVISVCDNGNGLTPEIRDRLFEPFAGTKPGGMGMGLSICRTIVEGHGGRIWTEVVEDGATFSFRLPVATVPP